MVTPKTKNYWEMIKMEIRMFCIRFCKRLAKTNRSKEIELLRKLKQLNVHLDQNPGVANLMTALQRVKLDLQKFPNIKRRVQL